MDAKVEKRDLDYILNEGKISNFKKSRKNSIITYFKFKLLFG